MVAPLKRVIVKRPQEAFVSAEGIARQWRDLAYTQPPDLDLACAQHEKFVSVLETSGVEVLRLPADGRTGLDSIYTHDPGIITDAGAVIFNTGKPQRRGEGDALASSLEQWGVPILGRVDGPAVAEGGDTLWLDRRTLAVGRGFRTNAPAVAALRRLLEPHGIEVVEFHLIYGSGPNEVLHLQSFVSLLDEALAVVHRRLLPVPLYEMLEERGFTLVDIPEEEVATQACNILTLAPRRAAMIAGNTVTRERLEAHGCTIHEFEASEISLKGMGGPTCLTRPLLRQS
jgi:N-dimethylarginine dimethylaminohydrolase